MLTLLLGSMFFSAIISVKGEIEEHDLVVSWQKPIISERNHVRNGTSLVLNATVFNNGSSTENVNLQIFTNGTSVLNSSTLNLKPGQIFWSAYFWAPEEGDYYVTAYTPPVENETSIENNTDTRWVRVCPDKPPIANFSFEPGIEPNIVLVDQNVTFDASASHDDLDWGKIESYHWNWNDGTLNTTIDPGINHTFRAWGTYNVSLTVVDNEELPDSVWQLATVEKKPVARFSVSKLHDYGEELPLYSYYVNDTLTFNASISRPDGGEILWYHWEFGDGTPPKNNSYPITTQTHIYTTPGIYNVTLTIGDNNTLTDSNTKTLNIIIGFPVAEFTIIESPTYYVNDTLTFDASASHDSDWGQIISYYWDFDDGTPLVIETDPITKHKYLAKGDYTATLTVTDNTALTSKSFNRTLSVFLRAYLRVEPQNATANPGERVSINITIENVEDLESFEFKVTWRPDWLPPTWPTLLGKPIDIMEGDFLGDEFGPEGRRWNFRSSQDVGEGYILINCTFSAVVPVVERSGSGTLASILFSVKSSGNTSLSIIETHLLSSSGSIPHELEHGYFYTTQPVANFSYSPRPVAPNQMVTFNASPSYDPDNLYDPTPDPITNYAWSFGDGTNDTGMIVTHTFVSSEVFPVNLTVTDDDGETWSIIYLVSTTNVDLHVEPCALAFNETLGCYETAGKLPINITLINHGALAETFTITIYANTTILVGTLTLKVSGGGSNSSIFNLEASTLQKGNYNISAHVLGNINYADYPVKVYFTGDVDHDNDVDIFDIVRISSAYGSKLGDLKYDLNCDLDCDEDVDIFDIVTTAGNYGQQDP